MKVQDLKNLNASATEYMRMNGVPAPDEQLLQRSLRTLAPELIAFWEAAHGEGDLQDGTEGVAGIDHALINLGHKASVL